MPSNIFKLDRWHRTLLRRKRGYTSPQSKRLEFVDMEKSKARAKSKALIDNDATGKNNTSVGNNAPMSALVPKIPVRAPEWQCLSQFGHDGTNGGVRFVVSSGTASSTTNTPFADNSLSDFDTGVYEIAMPVALYPIHNFTYDGIYSSAITGATTAATTISGEPDGNVFATTTPLLESTREHYNFWFSAQTDCLTRWLFVANYNQSIADTTSTSDAMLYGYHVLRWDKKAARQWQRREAMRKNLLCKPPTNRQLPNFNGLGQGELTALRLLKDLLTNAEWRRYLRYGFVIVEGLTGLTYQIIRGGQHVKVFARGRKVVELCLTCQRSLPPTDCVVARKIMLETDELGFWWEANIRSCTWQATHKPGINDLLQLAKGCTVDARTNISINA